MTDLYGLQKQALKERRRQALYFVTIIVVVVLSMGLGWTNSVIGREAWKQQAESWQTAYLSLYDEFTREVGEEPDAPAPNQVTGAPGKDGKERSAGPRGPEGPRGPAGPMCPDNYTPEEVVFPDAEGRLAFVCFLTVPR